MIIIVAMLMALGAIAFPLAVDIKKHGRDNILVRSGREVLAAPPIAVPLEFLSHLRRTARRVIETAAAFSIISSLIWLILKLLNIL